MKKKRSLVHLAQELREKHAELNSWRKVARACAVLTADGRPDPALAQRIARKGYDPRRPETRQRLGLPPTCFSCGKKIKRVRHVPAWVEQAVRNLQELEAAADVLLEGERVYARDGKRANTARDPPVFTSKLQIPLLS